MSTSPLNNTGGATPWQDKLEEACRAAQLVPPKFQIVSDRRGGRTAWSSTVEVQGQIVNARFWYDGRNLNNAKEDAAECAVNWLTGNSSNSTAASNTAAASTARSGW
ncbi:uncharacterized protein LMH87_009076 [Akanthomyces muscarius]|uniref:DRBM domain-containing protein n=1 Tax=Akanthomyces muscarius TaxID=2231603 RepID=A0A9W8QJY2_AKAMU|nr:uncharacterized protein LMH87_009076 [Akanthomyces muscarius]KAJ4158554.1 hypothetical protein LMH87_009076 [Akanthomyces muscarius]